MLRLEMGSWTPVMLAVVLMLLLVPHSSEGRKARGGRTQTQTRQSQRDRTETTESFPLDFTAVQDGNVDTFMEQVKNLAQSLYPCSAQKLEDEMKLHLLENSSVTCNDGTPAGYVSLPTPK